MLAGLSLLIATALAQEPACVLPDPVPAGTISVAWVSPVRQRVGAHRHLDVTPTTELRRWVARQESPTVGDLLHHTGQKKTTKTPKRLYKVTIFEVAGEDLCLSDVELPVTTYRIQWQDLARRGFCLLPAERFVNEAG